MEQQLLDSKKLMAMAMRLRYQAEKANGDPNGFVKYYIDYNKQRYQENKEVIKEQHRINYHANKEEYNRRRREKYALNKNIPISV